MEDDRLEHVKAAESQLRARKTHKINETNISGREIWKKLSFKRGTKLDKMQNCE